MSDPMTDPHTPADAALLRERAKPADALMLESVADLVERQSRGEDVQFIEPHGSHVATSLRALAVVLDERGAREVTDAMVERAARYLCEALSPLTWDETADALHIRGEYVDLASDVLTAALRPPT
jgi:hypothetical protein